MAIGSALALLFAPQSGAETRRQIKDLVGDGIDKARQRADSLREQLKGSAEELKARIAECRGETM